MKKIIALAVATAFVAPVMAAEVTISGDMEFQLQSPAAGDTTLKNDDNIITISATSEGNHGLTFSADMNYKLGTANGDGGESISVAGPLGKLSVGDNSSALDNTGDWTDVAPELGGFGADGEDHGILFTTTAAGIALAASYSPSADSVTGGIVNDAMGFSATYNAGAFSVYAGMNTREEANEDVDTVAYGIKYTNGGLYLALEAGTIEDTADSNDYTGIAVTYKMNDLTLGLENQVVDTETTGSDFKIGSATTASVDQNLTAVFAKYSLGGGATVYVESGSDDKAADTGETTTVGLSYSF